MLDYLVIGHICVDRLADRSTRLGGTALFAALTAHRLGLRVGVVTACAPDLDLGDLPSDLAVLRQPSPATTVFENRYVGNARVQRLHARAATITWADVPAAWLQAPIIHLAPIIDEVALPLPDQIGASYVAATPQGWLRHVTSDQIVVTQAHRLARLPFDQTKAVILSEEDVQSDPTQAVALAARMPLVALTRAERGATIFVNGAPTDVPAFPARVIDPTGAGDVFAAALLVALHHQADPIAAARWACAAAAYAIEGVGASALPSLDQVQARLQEAPRAPN